MQFRATEVPEFRTFGLPPFQASVARTEEPRDFGTSAPRAELVNNFASSTSHSITAKIRRFTVDLVKLAWFSPLPPSTSGIAAYSAELLPSLRARGVAIDAFSEANAHDFVWMHRRDPYDLTVFQMGNAACHDYMWAYVFRYPGVVVLHDAQLHQARALHLTKQWLPRRADYLAEFEANHPDAPPDVGELAALGGMGGTLFQHWPLIRLVLESARLTIVHHARLADTLRDRYPRSRIEAIEMGVSDPLAPAHATRSGAASAAPGHTTRSGAASAAPDQSRDVRQRHGIPDGAVVLAAFGGVTPEKRIPEILRALSAVAGRHPQLHFMIVGNSASYYDAVADARAWRIDDRVHLTGYVSDDALPDYLAAADVCACLRWPTNREMSASWLRCLAAGRTTLVTDLAHLVDLPTLDPRGWRVLTASAAQAKPVAVSIDLLDEDHSLQLALDRLASDQRLREQLGRAARAWWEAHHRLEPMADAYQRVLLAAREMAAPNVTLPTHLAADGSRRARALADELGITDRIADLWQP
jgi:glycosyltransferase involved in cell wall biosynthesis